MLRSLLLILGVLLARESFAQKPRLVRAVAYYDTTAVAELYNSTPVGLQLIYSDSTAYQTTGLLRGAVNWNKLTVNSSNGNIKNGILQFNRSQLVNDNYRITINVTTKDNETTQAILTLPRVIGIRFNLYADSIKRNVHYYLNVEGKFSSGKIFPLDTSVLRFSASEGKMIGQDLLLPLQDSLKSVTVEAWYKPHPEYYIRTIIPIKQAPDNESLLTNPDQLFQKKRKN